MSFREWAFKRSLAWVLLTCCLAFQPAWGQAKNSPIAFANEDAITPTLVASPTLGSAAASTSEALQWLQVEFHFGTTALVTKAYPFVDSVQFKIWIEGRDLYGKDAPDSRGTAIALTGQETYINVPMNQDLYGVFYVNPNALARYASDQGIDAFTRDFNIHIEAYVGGQLVDLIDEHKEQNPKWYAPLRVVPGLVYRVDQSPFVLTNPDRYPMLLLPSSGSAQASQ